METIINVYRGNYFLLAFHLLLLGVIAYAVVRMGRHPGLSLCVVVACLLDFANFFSSLLLNRDSDLYIVLEHVRRAGSLVGYSLLYLAVFGWRSRDRQRYGQGLDLRPAAAKGYGLPPTIAPVRIPVGWVSTLTVLYVLAFPVGLGLGYMDARGGGQNGPPDMLMILNVLAFGIMIIVDFILTMEILHRGWRAIQDEYVRTTPEKAIGYLFIPIYNLYWMFVAWAGLARGFNAFTSRYGIPARRLSEGFFTLQCVLALVGVVLVYIPVVGIIYSLVVSVLGLVLLWSITNAVNDLYAYRTGSRTASPDTAPIDEVPPPTEIADRAYAPPGYFD